jgi:thymidylate synthase (FAD)
MSECSLHVRVLESTSNALGLIYAACRQCYSEKFAGDILDESAADPVKQAEFVRKVVASGHESPLEHVKFTFAVEGVSRALTHQLVRHRLASYSQQSQRYVKETGFDYVVPPSLKQDPEALKEFVRLMEEIQLSYTRLLGVLKIRGVAGEAANQDARFVLPQASETKIVVTMNCRELLHFFQHRCCIRAQWEIRALAHEMLRLCREILPEVFADAGAKCEALGYCPEGPKFTCKRYPLKETVLTRKTL